VARPFWEIRKIRYLEKKNREESKTATGNRGSILGMRLAKFTYY
jgi:hypothetical protein